MSSNLPSQIFLKNWIAFLYHIFGRDSIFFIKNCLRCSLFVWCNLHHRNTRCLRSNHLKNRLSPNIKLKQEILTKGFFIKWQIKGLLLWLSAISKNLLLVLIVTSSMVFFNKSIQLYKKNQIYKTLKNLCCYIFAIL